MTPQEFERVLAAAMNNEAFAELIKDSAEELGVDVDDELSVRARTYDEAGILTTNLGVAVELADFTRADAGLDVSLTFAGTFRG